MKTYLFDTFNRYKRFSEELDAQTILCNKSWWIFNDSGEKEVYIFNTNGTLIISVSGRVTNATWQYIPANKSLIISGSKQSYMVHPAFYDNQIFVLQVDGTNDYVFLIDENNLSSTSLRSLADLKEYFAEKERQAALAEERKKQAELAALMQKQLEEEREKQRVEEKRIREEKEAEKKAIINELKESHPFKYEFIKWKADGYCTISYLFISALVAWDYFTDRGTDFILYHIIAWFFIVLGILMLCSFFFSPEEDEWGERLYQKHIEKNQEKIQKD